MPTPEPTKPETKVVEFHRLSMAAYEALEKKCPAPLVNSDTTAHQAGYMLGVQYVLTLLRDGYRVG